jgi:hypothetical protein
LLNLIADFGVLKSHGLSGQDSMLYGSRGCMAFETVAISRRKPLPGIFDTRSHGRI